MTQQTDQVATEKKLKAEWDYDWLASRSIALSVQNKPTNSMTITASSSLGDYEGSNSGTITATVAVSVATIEPTTTILCKRQQNNVT